MSNSEASSDLVLGTDWTGQGYMVIPKLSNHVNISESKETTNCLDQTFQLLELGVLPLCGLLESYKAIWMI